MASELWGVASSRDRLRSVEHELAEAGIEFSITVYPDEAAREWGDDVVLITPLGSFTGPERIRRALPLLRARHGAQEIAL